MKKMQFDRLTIGRICIAISLGILFGLLVLGVADNLYMSNAFYRRNAHILVVGCALLTIICIVFLYKILKKFQSTPAYIILCVNLIILALWCWVFVDIVNNEAAGWLTIPLFTPFISTFIGGHLILLAPKVAKIFGILIAIIIALWIVWLF
ncbi:hypothetical protein CQA53_09705 [Helicobacter didelphidarum]|uniref:Uncharacterized protein n=1 Tax=Helicobacter didelphidarum TaxID=2040648 RepID=A0A3D8I9N9_9HELI|nr:hypothetical protein [Helicobacter didelphidarum]RDU61872.1 hypothetical protein CQA53_09705 [Helicobacter didelphidarum]